MGEEGLEKAEGGALDLKGDTDVTRLPLPPECIGIPLELVVRELLRGGSFVGLLDVCDGAIIIVYAPVF